MSVGHKWLPIILISPLHQTKHFPWLPKPSNQQKSPLMWQLWPSLPGTHFVYSSVVQPEDRALEIAHCLIYSIIQLPCRRVTCWPRDIVSYQTSDWTTEDPHWVSAGKAVKGQEVFVSCSKCFLKRKCSRYWRRTQFAILGLIWHHIQLE